MLRFSWKKKNDPDLSLWHSFLADAGLELIVMAARPFLFVAET
jgi:hypothetical protein